MAAIDRPARRLRAVLVVVAATALLVACASAPDPTATGRPSSSSPAADAAANRAAAQAAADHLAATVALPPDAAPFSGHLDQLSEPVPGVPVSSQLVDTVRFVEVGSTVTRSVAWFREHPQAGLTVVGTASTTSPTQAEAFGFSYAPSGDRPAWGTATLDISVAALGQHSVVRVDGLAQWIDPTPTAITATGPTIRVTRAEGCPASDRGFTDVANPDAPDLDVRLLPDDDPTGATTCAYDGGNGTAFALLATHELDGSAASAAAARIRALPLGSRGEGAHTCPMDDGEVTISVFSYAGRPDVDIWQHTSGCAATDNGHILAPLV